jgi:hypothetical protein
MFTFQLYKKYITKSDTIIRTVKGQIRNYIMNKLIFVAGDNCQTSDEMQEKVLLFSEQNPDVEIIRLSAGKDEDTFEELTKGWRFNATPAFAAIVDGEVVDRHQGKLCEVRLGKMFTGGDEGN